MARGVEDSITGIQAEEDGTFTFEFRNWLIGTEVPNGSTYADTRVNLTGTDTLTTFETKRAQAIRDAATAMGLTVPASRGLLHTFKTA